MKIVSRNIIISKYNTRYIYLEQKGIMLYNVETTLGELEKKYNIKNGQIIIVKNFDREYKYKKVNNNWFAI